MARTFYAQCLSDLRAIHPDSTGPGGDGDLYLSRFVGTVFALDPCGRYHHKLSPNGVTERCVAYWAALDRAAERLGGWIESGDGDPCDIFFCLPGAAALDGDDDNVRL